MKQSLAMVSVLILILSVLFIPFIVLYSFLVHFTGQYYENVLLLLVFFILFAYLDLAIGSFFEICFNALTDVYPSIYVNKFITFFLECAVSYMVISAIDYFFEGVQLNALIKILIALFHTSASQLIERYKSDEEDDLSSSDENDLSPAIINEMTYHLNQHENWIECVDLFAEKYPDIPKSKIIATARKLHKRNISSQK